MSNKEVLLGFFDETSERLGAIGSFEDYRIACESTEGYRNEGVIDQGIYSRIIADERTIFAVTDFGKLPVFIHPDYSNGMDVNRCKELTDRNNILFASLPLSIVTEPIMMDNVDDVAIIVDMPSECWQDIGPEIIVHVETGANPRLCVFDQAKKVDNPEETAWLGLYMKNLESNNHTENKQRPGVVQRLAKTIVRHVLGYNPEQRSNVKLLFAEMNLPVLPVEGLTLFDNRDYAIYPEVFDKVWELFRDRFEWLGADHPVSMEDTREFFMDLLLSDHSYSVISFSESEPQCVGIYIDDIRECGWLGKNYVTNILGQRKDGTRSIYFFGLASVANAGSMHAGEVIKFLCLIESKLARYLQVFFESSNVSSRYIPRIVDRYIENSGCFEKKDACAPIAKQEYRYFTF